MSLATKLLFQFPNLGLHSFYKIPFAYTKQDSMEKRLGFRVTWAATCYGVFSWIKHLTFTFNCISSWQNRVHNLIRWLFKWKSVCNGTLDTLPISHLLNKYSHPSTAECWMLRAHTCPILQELPLSRGCLAREVVSLASPWRSP